MFRLACPLTHFMLPCVSQLNSFPNIVYCMCTEGREDAELSGGKLWKGELWEISGWAAQRYLCVFHYVFIMFGFCSASLSVLHISSLHCVTGIVGDILLNHAPLRGFTTFCLDMKPDFMKRSANPVSFYVMRTFWELLMDILWIIIKLLFHTRKLNLLFYISLYNYFFLLVNSYSYYLNFRVFPNKNPILIIK